MSCCHSKILNVNDVVKVPPFYADELTSKVAIPRFPMESKRPQMLTFLNALNNIVPSKDIFKVTGETPRLNISATTWLRKNYVTLQLRVIDVFGIDNRYIATAPPEKVDTALLLRYSITTISLILRSSYAVRIQKAYRNHQIYQRYQIHCNSIDAGIRFSIEEIDESIMTKQGKLSSGNENKGLYVGDSFILLKDVDEVILEKNGIISYKNMLPEARTVRYFGAGCDTVYEDSMKKDLLRSILEYESHLIRLDNLSNDRLVEPSDMVTCILHMFGRTSEQLIRAVLNHVIENPLYDEDEKDKRITEISNVIGRTIKAGVFGINIINMKKGES